MKIVIAGAGEMGRHLAKLLTDANHAVTVVDADAKALSELASTTDVVTVEGDSTTFTALRKAGVRKCDLFIAVNHEENDNVVAALLAKQLGARKSIARIDNSEYLEPNNKEMFVNLGIDDLFYPERVAAREVGSVLSHADVAIKNLMILGGSRIGVRLAMDLQEQVNIKLVEYDAEKAYKLAEILDKTLIINEDGRHVEAMLEEGLSHMDAFVAVTGRSETNILASMFAKRIGVKKVIAEIENLDYINLAESVGIDMIINKKLITASKLSTLFN